MRQRLITAAIIIPIVLGFLLAGPPYSLILGCLVYVAIQYEYSRFAPLIRDSYRNLYFITSLAMLPALYLNSFSGMIFSFLGLITAHFCIVVSIIEREPNKIDFNNLLLAFFLGSLYLGLFGVTLVYSLTLLPPSYTVWCVVVVALSDSGAYFGGSYFGGKKLAPRISPNKTVSGSISGIITSVLLASLLGYYLFPSTSISILVLSSFLITIFAGIGDLVESLVKRCFDVKDSGSLLPGHGGVLDRVDAILFAIPLALLLSGSFGF